MVLLQSSPASRGHNGPTLERRLRPVTARPSPIWPSCWLSWCLIGISRSHLPSSLASLSLSLPPSAASPAPLHSSPSSRSVLHQSPPACLFSSTGCRHSSQTPPFILPPIFYFHTLCPSPILVSPSSMSPLLKKSQSAVVRRPQQPSFIRANPSYPFLTHPAFFGEMQRG